MLQVPQCHAAQHSIHSDCQQPCSIHTAADNARCLPSWLGLMVPATDSNPPVEAIQQHALADLSS
jgi:hypothetical protein